MKVGGRGVFYIDSWGYVRLKKPGHPRADKQGYVKEHILIAEKQLGRPLKKGEAVHHTDLARGKINPFGLVVCASNAEHKKLHVEMSALVACGNKDYRKCHYCKQYDDPANLYKRGDRPESSYRHRGCHNNYKLARKFILQKAKEGQP